MNKDFSEKMIAYSSVKLENGGDTHIHPWKQATGFEITTRLKGGFDDHEHIRINKFLSTPTDPSVLKHIK